MEAPRRILNTSLNLPWDVTVEHLNKYAFSMKISGYTQFDRYHAINGAITWYKEMKK